MVERDAFLIAWAHRLETRPIAAASVPDPDVATIAGLYARRGVRIDVHLLPTDCTAVVAMAVGWSAGEPAVVVGSGCLAGIRCAPPALQCWRSGRYGPPCVPGCAILRCWPAATNWSPTRRWWPISTITTCCTPTARPPSVPWRICAPRTDRVGNSAPTGPQLGRPGRVVGRDRRRCAVVDVTPDDVAALGVRVVRSIVPGFQPIHFGADQARLGHRRLFSAPHRWGLRERPAGPADLNPDPHPLA